MIAGMEQMPEGGGLFWEADESLHPLHPKPAGPPPLLQRQPSLRGEKVKARSKRDNVYGAAQGPSGHAPLMRHSDQMGKVSGAESNSVHWATKLAESPAGSHQPPKAPSPAPPRTPAGAPGA